MQIEARGDLGRGFKKMVVPQMASTEEYNLNRLAGAKSEQQAEPLAKGGGGRQLQVGAQPKRRAGHIG